MEDLKNKQFGSPDELCQWVNKNAIKITSIIANDYKWILFYKKILD